MTSQPTAIDVKKALDKAQRNLARTIRKYSGAKPTETERLNMKLNQNLKDGTIKIENPPTAEELNAEQVANIMMIYRPVKVIREPKC